MRIFPIFMPFTENPRILSTETEIRMLTYNLWVFLYRSAKLQFRNRSRGYEILDFINPCTFFEDTVPDICRAISRHGIQYRAEHRSARILEKRYMGFSNQVFHIS